jgi:2-oxoisovalerate dehydrogenase E2 component (dihydrolipoyl transacylase)
MKIFNLPDLGEGLPDAEIVEWHVAEGDTVKVDQPMVSMETAKAVVDVPSPENAVVGKLYGQPGDIIDTGNPLVGFLEDGEGAADADADAVEDDQNSATNTSADDSAAEQASSSEADAEATDATDAAEQSASETDNEEQNEDERADTGTVVGAMETSDRVQVEALSTVGGVKVSPAVRALARKLKIDLSRVKPTGADGVVTAKDLKAVADNPQLLAAEQQPPPAQHQPKPEVTKPGQSASDVSSNKAHVQSEDPAPYRTEAQHQPASGEWEPIRGTRRTMARIMSEAHAQVVATTLMDDADIHAWQPGEDITIRLLRSLWAGAQAEPGLNAWYNGKDNVRMLHKGMDVGIAVDTPDGLFVPALRGVHRSSRAELRAGLNRLRDNVRDRSIPPEDLKDYTIMLSNFGVFAGRYATPIINPPCVCIVAAGKLRHDAVPVLGSRRIASSRCH